MRPIAVLLLVLSSACSSDEAAVPPMPDGGATIPDAAALVDAALDAPAVQATACPTSGKDGIVVAGATCVLVTPLETGAAASGEAADVPSYAIAPTSGASGKLVVFLNGSGGSPAAGAADPVENVYNAALAAGHHVIGLSYRSGEAVGTLCSSDACYLPTRLTILTGVYQSGAAAELADIQTSEGVHERLTLLLLHLGWTQFLVAGAPNDDGGSAVDWSKVIVTGHSQGGGHAALLGKIHGVARIVSLSSPCDRVGKTVASWLNVDASWKTDTATRGFGFGAATEFDADGNATGGDTICAAHAAAWQAMGLSSLRSFDDAIVCGAGGAHGATIGCTQNYPRLVELYAD